MFGPYAVEAICADMPDPTGAQRRGLEFLRAIVDLAGRRGHAISGTCKHTLIVGDTPVEFYLYERSAQYRVPLTKTEMKSILFSDRAKRDGKIAYRRSGWLQLVYKIDGRSEYRIAERARHPFEAQAILDRFESLAAEAAARRRAEAEEEREKRRRAVERAKSRRVETRRWDAMHETMAAAEKAARLRRFIDLIATHSPMRPDQEKRVRKWARWANAHADAIDPMAREFDDVLARLGLRK